MIAITCEKCRRRFTPTLEALQGYFAASQGKKYALILCPHCGKGNKVSMQRLQKEVRPAVAAAEPEPAPVSAGGTGAEPPSTAEPERPPAQQPETAFTEAESPQ